MLHNTDAIQLIFPSFTTLFFYRFASFNFIFRILYFSFMILIIYLQQPLNYCQFIFPKWSSCLSLHPIRLKLCSLYATCTGIGQFFCYYENMSTIFSRLFRLSYLLSLHPSLPLLQPFALSPLRVVAVHLSFYLCTFSDFLASLIKWPDLQSLNESPYPRARLSLTSVYSLSKMLTALLFISFIAVHCHCFHYTLVKILLLLLLLLRFEILPLIG